MRHDETVVSAVPKKGDDRLSVTRAAASQSALWNTSKIGAYGAH